MNIRVTSTEYLSPTFLLPTLEILDILVKGALTFAHAVKRRRRGKRVGALMRFRQRGLRTPLPGIIFSNVRSLSNKLDELKLLFGKKQGLFFICCFVLHGDMAVWINTGLCAAAGRLPAPQS